MSSAKEQHDVAQIHTPRSERPYLLPYNRRLRHLRAISFRNIDLEYLPSRARGQTIDDEAVINTLQSPGKALALRETRELTHARSSGDLRAHGTTAKGQANGDAGSNGHISLPIPRRPRKPRRRSTMDWTNTTSSERQAKFRNAVTQHCVDIFFSIHIDGVEEPTYVSEVQRNSMNPDFEEFDLTGLCANLLHVQRVIVKAWARHDQSSPWKFHIQQTTNLAALQFIGKSLDRFPQPLPDNAVLFHMTDGIYAALTDYSLPANVSKHAATFTDTATLPNAERTSTYDALMRLSTLDDAIQDALATHARLTSEINSFISTNHAAVSSQQSVSLGQSSRQNTLNALAAAHTTTASAKAQLDAAKARLQARKDSMAAGRAEQLSLQTSLDSGRETLTQQREAHKAAQEAISGQRRRICEDLLKIYPIEPIPGRSLAFTIRGLHLPDTASFEAPDVREDEVSAALGHVAHLVHLLSFYLATPLPYPITVSSSTSTISDPISLMPRGSRTFSLQLGTRGSTNLFYRFEYAVFLLNKDIDVLATRQGLRLPDPRQTLPNLKYLLFVATAGRGDLPLRKAGGIRGLLRGALGSSGYRSPLSESGSSRRGSQESGFFGQGVAMTAAASAAAVAKKPP